MLLTTNTCKLNLTKIFVEVHHFKNTTTIFHLKKTSKSLLFALNQRPLMTQQNTLLYTNLVSIMSVTRYKMKSKHTLTKGVNAVLNYCVVHHSFNICLYLNSWNSYSKSINLYDATTKSVLHIRHQLCQISNLFKIVTFKKHLFILRKEQSYIVTSCTALILSVQGQ